MILSPIFLVMAACAATVMFMNAASLPIAMVMLIEYSG